MADQSTQAARRARSSRRAAAPMLSVILGLVLSGAPAHADPAVSPVGTAGCWQGADAPGLFSWPSTPGIACRNAGRAGVPQQAPQGATQADPLRDATSSPHTFPADGGTRFTFSGSARIGLAVAF